MDKLTPEQVSDLNKINDLALQLETIVHPKHYDNSFYATFDCTAMGMKSAVKSIFFRAGLGKSDTSFDIEKEG